MKKVTIFYSIGIIFNIVSFIIFGNWWNIVSIIFLGLSYLGCRFDINHYHLGLLPKFTKRDNILATFVPESCPSFRKSMLLQRYCEVILKLRRSDWQRYRYGFSTPLSVKEYPLEFEMILIFSPTKFNKVIYNNCSSRPEFLKEIREKIIIHDNCKKNKIYSTNKNKNEDYIGVYESELLKKYNLHYDIYFTPIIQPTYFSEGMDRLIGYIKELLETNDFDNEFNYIRNRCIRPE